MISATFSAQHLITSPRLLVAQSGFLGDVVLTTPLIAELRRRLSPESLTVLTTPQARPLLEHHPAVNHIVVDAKRSERKGMRGLLNMAQQLKRKHFTLAVAAHKSLRTSLLLALTGIPHRIGFRQSPGWFLYHSTAKRDQNRHEVERILCLMRSFGVEPEDCERRLLVSYEDSTRVKAQALLLSHGINEKEVVVIVCPGSVWPTKRWTTAGYAELIRQLTCHYGKVLICGGPDDAPVAQAIHEQSGAKGVNLVGQADLSTFMGLVDRARLVISNDSAPMHIAVARNVPVVAIFCATTPSLGYGPYSTHSVVVEQKDLFCRPCGRHGAMICPRKTDACMQLITVRDVLAGVDHLLARTAHIYSSWQLRPESRVV